METNEIMNRFIEKTKTQLVIHDCIIAFIVSTLMAAFVCVPYCIAYNPIEINTISGEAITNPLDYANIWLRASIFISTITGITCLASVAGRD